MIHFYKNVVSPVGTLKIVGTDKGLAAILWENDSPSRVKLDELIENPSHPILVQTERELREYFAGNRTKFDVKLDMVGTEFQKDVWNALLTIPFGETRSYRDIARQVRRPTAFRAVGAANSRNPISIITPCHRAIGSDGSLTGFAGGLETKKYLLEHEAHEAQVAA